MSPVTPTRLQLTSSCPCTTNVPFDAEAVAVTVGEAESILLDSATRTRSTASTTTKATIAAQAVAASATATRRDFRRPPAAVPLKLSARPDITLTRVLPLLELAFTTGFTCEKTSPMPSSGLATASQKKPGFESAGFVPLPRCESKRSRGVTARRDSPELETTRDESIPSFTFRPLPILRPLPAMGIACVNDLTLPEPSASSSFSASWRVLPAGASVRSCPLSKILRALPASASVSAWSLVACASMLSVALDIEWLLSAANERALPAAVAKSCSVLGAQLSS